MDLFSIHEQPHQWWEQSYQSPRSGASARLQPGYCMVGDRKVWRPIPTVLQKKTGLLPKHWPILCSYPTPFVKQSYNLGLPPRKHQESRAQGEAPQVSTGKHGVGVATAPSTTPISNSPKSPRSEGTQCRCQDNSLRREALGKTQKVPAQAVVSPLLAVWCTFLASSGDLGWWCCGHTHFPFSAS